MKKDTVSKASIVNKIIATETHPSEKIFERKGSIYTFLNPVSYLDAMQQKDLYSSFNGIWADGSILVAAIRLLYGKKVTRRSFDMTSLAPMLFDYAAQNEKTIYIVASKQDEVDEAIGILKERNPQIKIIGYRNGYFANKEEWDKEIRHITSLSPDFLIVGMGIIKQEEFLLAAREAGYSGIGFTCGGFIHQTAKGEIDYYPDWINRLNLRFVYRMVKERHTRQRYFKAAFLFPSRFIIERFFG